MAAEAGKGSEEAVSGLNRAAKCSTASWGKKDKRLAFVGKSTGLDGKMWLGSLGSWLSLEFGGCQKQQRRYD